MCCMPAPVIASRPDSIAIIGAEVGSPPRATVTTAAARATVATSTAITARAGRTFSCFSVTRSLLVAKTIGDRHEAQPLRKCVNGLGNLRSLDVEIVQAIDAFPRMRCHRAAGTFGGRFATFAT